MLTFKKCLDSIQLTETSTKPLLQLEKNNITIFVIKLACNLFYLYSIPLINFNLYLLKCALNSLKIKLLS